MTFSAPRAGVVLDALIEAFDLRRWDADGTLSFATSRRYLSGHRAKEDGEWSVFLATADAFVASGLMPNVISPTDLAMSEPGAAVMQALEPRDLLAAFLSVHARRWDELVGELAAWSAPIVFPGQMAGAYLRLVTIDAAVRLGALRRRVWRDPLSAVDVIHSRRRVDEDRRRDRNPVGSSGSSPTRESRPSGSFVLIRLDLLDRRGSDGASGGSLGRS